MFTYKIPKNKYDLIYTVATAHHGYKDQVKRVIEQIKTALMVGGSTFVTLPLDDSKDEWQSFKTHEELAPGVITPVSGPEKGLPHSLFTRQEVEEIFSGFSDLRLVADPIKRWLITAHK